MMSTHAHKFQVPCDTPACIMNNINRWHHYTTQCFITASIMKCLFDALIQTISAQLVFIKWHWFMVTHTRKTCWRCTLYWQLIRNSWAEQNNALCSNYFSNQTVCVFFFFLVGWGFLFFFFAKRHSSLISYNYQVHHFQKKKHADKYKYTC